VQKEAFYTRLHVFGHAKFGRVVHDIFAMSGEPDSKSDNPCTHNTLMHIMRSSSNGKSLFFPLCFFQFKSPILLFYSSILTFPQKIPTTVTYWRQEELAFRLLTHTTPVSRGYSVSMRHRCAEANSVQRPNSSSH